MTWLNKFKPLKFLSIRGDLRSIKGTLKGVIPIQMSSSAEGSHPHQFIEKWERLRPYALELMPEILFKHLSRRTWNVRLCERSLRTLTSCSMPEVLRHCAYVQSQMKTKLSVSGYMAIDSRVCDPCSQRTFWVGFWRVDCQRLSKSCLSSQSLILNYLIAS